MDDHPTKQELLARQAAELVELRELLAAVASALERLGEDEPDTAFQHWNGSRQEEPPWIALSPSPGSDWPSPCSAGSGSSRNALP
jgi:hypothetical protein